MFLLSRACSYGAIVSEETQAGVGGGIDGPRRPGFGKRASSVREGDLTERNYRNPTYQPRAAERMPTGGTPKDSSRIADLNVLENGFCRDLLHFDGRLEGQDVRVLIDGGSMGDFVAAELVK